VVEKVLVLPRASVPGGCDFTGIRTVDGTTARDLAAAVARHGFYAERAAAEEDSQLKQLIPYVVVRDGDAVFLMERTDAGGDARLHRKASLGVGGHINPVDAGGDALAAGLRREWDEELIADWEPEFVLLGLLNDDSNPVGSVHLGVVYEVDASSRQVAVREHEKLRGRFAATGEIRAAWERLETWSQLVARQLLGIGPD
jgi:predicted NUDIX family phosphoesterase